MDNKDLEKRVIAALEKQYGERVYLNHANVVANEIHVDFKTEGGLMGLASFQFTQRTLKRIA